VSEKDNISHLSTRISEIARAFNNSKYKFVGSVAGEAWRWEIKFQKTSGEFVCISAQITPTDPGELIRSVIQSGLKRDQSK